MDWYNEKFLLYLKNHVYVLLMGSDVRAADFIFQLCAVHDNVHLGFWTLWFATYELG